MTDTVRVYDLAKELNLPNKEVIELLDKKLGVKVKSHSSVISELQAKKLKEILKEPKADQVKKPKAFIVKKAKQKPEEENNKEEKPVEQKPAEKIKLGKIEQPHPIPVPRVKLGKIEPVLPPRPQKQAKPASNDVAKKESEKNIQEIKKENASHSSGTKQEKSEKKPIQRHIIPQEIYESKGGPKKKSSKKKEKLYKSKEEEQERISLEKANAQKHKKRTHVEEVVEEVKSVVINQPLTVGELSEKINKASAEIVKFLMMEGILATVNQVIDVATAKKVCEHFEIEVQEEDLDAYIEEELQKEEAAKELAAVDPKLLKRRAPVISIMGHVDHGKTTLLDSIRASKHKIVSTEVGGITQSIGAYTVYLNNKKIVFIDTPGHEAFTEMRARGAQATDIAILVVAADDGIMPQTIEAINHAKAANVPIIVAVNKCDKPDANPDKVMQQLTEYGLVPEEWGGDTVCVKVSALQGTGIDELLEYILLLAEVQDLKANPDAPASGVVIEANLDKGKGPVATLLVQNGTLKTGNCVVVGNVCGKVRALLSDSGERVKKAAPSTPVEILGLTEVPQAGDKFEVVENEKVMRAIVAERKEKERTNRLEAMLPAHIRNEVVGEGEDGFQHLNLIIKANTNGSAEALSQAIGQFKSNEIIIKLIHVGVGDISEADVMLAAASKAIILGFSVKEDNNAELAAQREGVTIKKFDIIYQILEDLEKTMLHLLQPEIKEVALGKAEVRQIFTVGKTGRIAGCYVTEGKILRGKTAKIVRNGETIFTGTIDQLKRFKDDVKEVATGFECGISFAKFNDIQEGDIIEVSTTEEIERQALV